MADMDIAREGDPLVEASPPTRDVEGKRARAAIEARLFSGPRQPVTVGRYEIGGRLGAGGMGVVYRAHDPELARDVAVKLLNADATITSAAADNARARQVREARAMARLAHPNVIHVYDVGTVADGVFIAMELVEGRSLAKWVEGKRPWRDVLRRMIDAGRGLAAAHAAGLVHRDFKPENVLVGDDGRVRVVDFGLAGGDSSETNPTPQSGADLDRSIGDSLTRTGALLGTPKYMAPEQAIGEVATARSDQFSFCVTLFEALYGYPPFAGNTVEEYRQNVLSGTVEPPPADTRVRGWVHTEIVQGLSVDPDARHPDLDTLLDKLEEALVDPKVERRRRIRLFRDLGAVLVIGGFVAWWTLGRPDPAPIDRAPPPVTSAGKDQPIDPSAAVVAPPATAPSSPTPAAAGGSGGIDDAPTPPIPGTTTQDAAQGDSGNSADTTEPVARPKPARPRRTGVCYFTERDKNNIARLKKRRSTIRRDGKCYVCNAPGYDLRKTSQLFPNDCRLNLLCHEDPTKCTD